MCVCVRELCCVCMCAWKAGEVGVLCTLTLTLTLTLTPIQIGCGGAACWALKADHTADIWGDPKRGGAVGRGVVCRGGA